MVRKTIHNSEILTFVKQKKREVLNYSYIMTVNIQEKD